MDRVKVALDFVYYYYFYYLDFISVTSHIKNHVYAIARKICKSVGVLFKLLKYLPIAIMKTVHYSLINPFLLYGFFYFCYLTINVTIYKCILFSTCGSACGSVRQYTSITEH